MNKITSNIRNYSFGLILLSCMGGMSCTREADIDMTDTDGVVFSANIGQTSRRGDNSWTGGELIGMQVGESIKTYRISDATTGAMVTDDEPYTWTSGEYQLHAWSPYTDKSISLTDQSDAEKMFACDLLECNATVNAKSVQLTFKHKMTRVWYELQQFPGYTDEEANNAVISYYGSPSIKYAKGIIEKEGEPNTEISTRKIDDRHGEAILVPGEMWDKPFIKVVIGGDTYVYTPKHTVATDEERWTGVLKEGYNQRYYLKVSKKGIEVSMASSSVGWDNETVDGVTDGKYKAEIPSNLNNPQITGVENGIITDADKSFSISYTENGNGGLLYEGNCTVQRTTDGTSHTYTFSKIASDIKVSYTSEYLKVGKYYYSNGTFGDEAVKEGCETVGLVYKLGASKNEYDTDQIDNYSGSELKSITGYVLCIDSRIPSTEPDLGWKKDDGTYNGTEFDSWENNEERYNATTFNGYQFTQEIAEKLQSSDINNFPLWQTFKGLNLQAPENTSGWYIPSIEQIKDVVSADIHDKVTFTGNYYSSNIYYYTQEMANSGENHKWNDEKIVHSWALKYNVETQETSGGYPSDPAKLMIILTF
ncbi:fimbrillin family protein [Phocaeicola plebeius]|uniref:fimbrillin family protein n=1 Tax=Phocaeicola plebeius TaxID=310297 RepID=UPI0026E9ADE1|nr:fimbrillin family protein [Phocaeicola plebeius]